MCCVSRRMDDHKICNLISLSVGAVMRQSLNDSFKEECKNILGAADTKTVEKLLYQKLKEVTETKGTFIQHVPKDCNLYQSNLPALVAPPASSLMIYDNSGNEVSSQVKRTRDEMQIHPGQTTPREPDVSDDESDLIWE